MTIPKATHHGKIGDVDCYVLEDSRCVLSKTSGFQQLTGSTGTGNLDRYVARLREKVGEIEVRPVFQFVTLSGAVAQAIDDESFSNIIDAYVDGLVFNKLHPQQVPVAQRAYELQRAWAKVGLRAHILSVTGAAPATTVQRIRSYADRILRREPREWEKRFNSEFITAMCEVYGWTQVGKRVPPQMSAVFDKLYRLILGRDGRAALKARCPNPEHGNNQHQYLADEIDRDLPGMTVAIAYIARTSGRNVEFFWRRVSELLGVSAAQMIFPYPEEPAE